jgi:hypothetical protein
MGIALGDCLGLLLALQSQLLVARLQTLGAAFGEG